MRVMTHPNRQRGVTLIELMVALVMGLVLLAGVAAIFVANKESFRVQEGLARSQEGGRFAILMIERELRSAGYRGCTSMRSKEAITNAVTDLGTSQFGKFDRPVIAFSSDGSTWTPALDTEFSKLTYKPIGNSDVLLIRSPTSYENGVSTHQTRTADLVVTGNTSLTAGRIAMVSDCRTAAVFRVTGVSSSGSGTGATSTISHGGKDLGSRFSNDETGTKGSAAEVQPMRAVAYYVAPSGAIPGRMSLWRWEGSPAAPEEVVEGVEQLLVRFGMDDTGQPPPARVRRYLAPASIAASLDTVNGDWDLIQSVRVTLVVSSNEERLTPEAAGVAIDVNLDGDKTDAGETESTRLRQVYTTTVAVRNRQS